MKYDIGACRKAKECRYGTCCSSGTFYICDYLKVTGRPITREKNGEIIDGVCGLYQPKVKK